MSKNKSENYTGTRMPARTQHGDGKGKRTAIRRAPSFFKTYVTNVLPTATREDFRVELFNERFKAGGGWVYRSEGSLILTRAAAKKLAIELSKKVEAYEAEHGEINAAEALGPVDYIT
jgi:hypothetical protein